MPNCTAMKQLLILSACPFFLLIYSPVLEAQYAAAKFTQTAENALLNIAVSENYTPPNAINGLKAALEKKSINLEWSVSSLAEPASFIIERSFDGEHFEVIGSDATAISNTHKKSFSFTDKPGNKVLQHRDIFYRLGTLTENSSYLYTKPLLVHIKHKGIVEYITVFPHPSKNDINMILGLKENGYFSARITDSEGLEKMKLKQKVNSGQQLLTFGGSRQLTPGIYWLEVQVDSKETLKMKLIKE